MTTNTQYAPMGKVRKVTSLRTSDEERQARIRERRMQRQRAKQQAMIQAVEQAVALPEPLPRTIAKEEVAVVDTPCKEPQKRPIGAMMGTINSLIDRMRIFVLEE